MNIRFLGHSCFELSDGDARVLVDPFLTGNPKAAIKASRFMMSSNRERGRLDAVYRQRRARFEDHLTVAR